MLFFFICAAFALFPERVINGASSGIAVCINTVIPSLLPFMLISSCMIKSRFSLPLGSVLSKFLSPLTGMGKVGCACFIAGLIGGYGSGAKAVSDSVREGQITQKEGECLIAFCNNAGPLFIIGTVGIGFFSDVRTGIILFIIQVISAITCAYVFRYKGVQKKTSLSDDINFYRQTRPSYGKLISECAVSSGTAMLTVCVFIITFSAIINLLPVENHPFITGIIEVTCGIRTLSRNGLSSLPYISALLSWGGISVHLQAAALTKDILSMKKSYLGKIFSAFISFVLTYIYYIDVYIFIYTCISILVFLLFGGLILKSLPPRANRQRQHS